jgi:hypothetical protein
MTVQEINSERNSRGVFAIESNLGEWFAISKDGINMITFYEGKFTFTKSSIIDKLYTENDFAKKITQLLNK